MATELKVKKVNETKEKSVKPKKSSGISLNGGSNDINFTDIAVNLSDMVRCGLLDDAFCYFEQIDDVYKLLAKKTQNSLIILGHEKTGKVAVIKGLAYRLIKNERYRNPDTWEIDNELQSDTLIKKTGYQNKPNIYQKDIWMISIDKAYSMISQLMATRPRPGLDSLRDIIIKKLKSDQNIIIYVRNFKYMPGIFGSSVMRSKTLENIHTMFEDIKREIDCQIILDVDLLPSIKNNMFSKFKQDLSSWKEFNVYEMPLPSKSEVELLSKHSLDVMSNYHKLKYTPTAIKLAKEQALKENDLPKDTFSLSVFEEILDNSAVLARFDEQETVGVEYIKSTTKKLNLNPISPTDEKSLAIQKNWTKLESNVYNKVKGQDRAVNTVLRRVKTGLSPFRPQNKPIASFMFAGTTGTGKTYLSQTIASGLDIPFLRIDMSEFYEDHTVARFIGSPPGYVGSLKGGQLTNWVLENPFSFILLDEIDKAHPKILDAMMQVLDAGRLTSGTGQEVDMTQTIVAMTTNFGADSIKNANKVTGFGDSSDSQIATDIESGVRKALENELRPEFINRFDEIIVFKPIEKDILISLVKSKISELKESAKVNENIDITVSNKVIEILAKLGFSKEYGVRPLQREIDSLIRFQLAELWSSQKINGKKIKVSSSLSLDEIKALGDSKLDQAKLRESVGFELV